VAKTARLDQILLQLGYVHVDEVARALRRQKAHGGRLGMNLVQLGAITEEQLLIALAEQFRMPTLKPSEADVPPELLLRMPEDVISAGLVVPLAWSEAQKVLSVATADPGDEDVLRRVKAAFGARGMRVGIAPEGLMAALGRRLSPPKAGGSARAGGPAPSGGKVALPELFASEPAEARQGHGPTTTAGDTRRVVMITALTSRRDFLSPIFEREGSRLVVVSDDEGLVRALGEPVDRVLVSEEMSDWFEERRRAGLSCGGAEIVRFTSVSGALMDNPLGYGDTVRSLRSAVQALADYRSGELGVSPPYGLIAADVAGLAKGLGLGRVASDALDLCAHLLLPTPARGEAALGHGEPFAAFASSLELATRLRFPWPLDGVLVLCHRLYRGDAAPDEAGGDEETSLAGQILALAWYRHNHADPVRGTDEERMLGLRAALRGVAKRLASTPVVEAYVNLISERGTLDEDGFDRQVLLAGGDRITRALTPALARVGRETVVSVDLTDAQAMVQRRVPAAIIVDFEAFAEGVDRFTRVTKLGDETLLFVLTDSTDPALVLNLLDVGVDDVFGPPHDFDLVAARVNRAIRSRARVPRAGTDAPGQFSATFEVFSFLDLVQMLSQGLKTVRIDLSRDAEVAVIFMRKGRIIDATLGELRGEAAVHAVLHWEDHGAFTVREEADLPEPTIHAPTESVLMEGLRLLDESRR